MHFKSLRIRMFSAVLLWFLAMSPSEAYSQKFMYGYGFSIFSDWTFFTTVEAHESLIDKYSIAGISYLSISGEAKYNLTEFNSDLALSLATSPSIGTMVFPDNHWFGNLRLPLYVQLDYGNLSTFECMKNMGIGLGFGYQFDIYGLFGESEPLTLGSLAARLGVRYFNRNNRSREIAIKMTLPKTVELNSYEGNGNLSVEDDEIKVTSVQLSWILYLNY